MPRHAAVMIKPLPHYRRDSFERGLTRHGYSVSPQMKMRPEPGDLLVCWNRHDQYDRVAKIYEAAGAKVLVVENGYIGEDSQGIQFYAIARNQHNGCGTWEVGDEDRWAKLDIGLRRWRRRGDHVLVLPQRGIGPPGVGMPRDWPVHIRRRIERVTDRPVRIRPHPGKLRPPLEPDLENAWAVVTWGSGAAVKSLVAGIPVFFELEHWVCRDAGVFGISDVEAPFLGDRLPALRKLAWAQWSVAEIAAGEPFAWLL